MEIDSYWLFYQILFAGIYLFRYDLIDPDLKPRDVPQEELKGEYNFVIIGGGIAGCVLANRITAVKDFTVLLIEAGGDESFLASVPLLYRYLQYSENDWYFQTVPQKNACQEFGGWCPYPRGKGLGGSSILYSGGFVRGNRRDFDKIANESQLYDWSYKMLLPYFIQLENATGLHRPKSKYRGYEGPLPVGYAAYHSEFTRNYIKAGQEYGWKERDYNGEIQENTISYRQLNVDENIKVTAARAYLYPIKDRPNLDIIKNSFVTKIIIVKQEENVYRATGVEYYRNGETHIVNATYDVILTAGIVNSPKLLMLSGIGPKEDLEVNGIPCLVDLPVGKNLQDQVSVSLSFEINKNVTLTTNVWRTIGSILAFILKNKGPLSTSGMGAVAYNGEESSDQPPTISYGFDTIKWDLYNTQHTPIFTVSVNLLHPKSKGTIRLQGSDPWSQPSIDPNYLAEKEDYEMLRKGAEEVFKIIKTPTMRKFRPKLHTDQQPNCADFADSEGKRYVKCLMDNYVYSRVRPFGTTRLGNTTDPEAVVDGSLIVKQVYNLRVAGSSVMPWQITGYTYGTTYAIGELASIFVFETYLSALKIKPQATESYINASTKVAPSTSKKPHVPSLPSPLQQASAALLEALKQRKL